MCVIASANTLVWATVSRSCFVRQESMAGVQWCEDNFERNLSILPKCSQYRARMGPLVGNSKSCLRTFDTENRTGFQKSYIWERMTQRAAELFLFSFSPLHLSPFFSPPFSPFLLVPNHFGGGGVIYLLLICFWDGILLYTPAWSGTYPVANFSFNSSQSPCPQPSKCWDYGQEAPYLTEFLLRW